MNHKIWPILIASLLLLPLGAAADDGVRSTETSKSYQVGFGTTRLLDTYLSQQAFSGGGLSFLTTSETQRNDSVPSAWHTLIEHQASLSLTNDKSELRDELQGDYSLYVGRLYGKRVALGGHGQLYLQAGGLIGANIGFIYNTSNSNNPAQARLSLNLVPTGAATYTTQLWNRKLALRYELNLPLAGVAFSPNYGQSYYEMFSQGNYDHNIVPTTFISAPNFRQQFSIDYRLWQNAMLRIGYLGDYQQMEVNNLKSHVYHHRIMIGYIHSLTHVKTIKRKK